MLDEELVWTTKDGRKIPLPKLEEEHLKNIVEMWRMGRGPKQDIDVFGYFPNRELITRGILWECISRGMMDGDSGEWLREPEVRCDKVDAEYQLELAQRIIACGVHL